MKKTISFMVLVWITAMACSAQVLYDGGDITTNTAWTLYETTAPGVDVSPANGLIDAPANNGPISNGATTGWQLIDQNGDGSLNLPQFRHPFSPSLAADMAAQGFTLTLEVACKGTNGGIWFGYDGDSPFGPSDARVNAIPDAAIPNDGAIHTVTLIWRNGTLTRSVDGGAPTTLSFSTSSANNYTGNDDGSAMLMVDSGSSSALTARWDIYSANLTVNFMIVTEETDGGTLVAEEGATSDSFTVELAEQPSETVTLTVAPPAGSADFDLGAGPGSALELTFTTNDWDSAQTVTVTAVDDAIEEFDKLAIVTLTAASADADFDGSLDQLIVTVLDNDMAVQEINTFSQPFISPKGAYVTNVNEYHTFRIPGMVVAADGSLLAFAEGRRGTGADPRTQDDAPIDMCMRRSTDGGVTWGPLVVIDPGFKTNGAMVDFGDPTPVLDEITGDIHLVYGQWPDKGPITADWGNDPDSADGNQVAWVQSSSDNGVTWSGSTQIDYPDEPGETSDGLYWRFANPGPGNGIQLRWQTDPALNGRLVIPSKRSASATVDGSASRHGHVFFSDDHGTTWQVGDVASAGGNENEVVERIDGQLLLDARASWRTRFTSDDGGNTWADAPSSDIPVTTVDCSLIRYSAKRDGHDRDRMLFSGPAGDPEGSGSGRFNQVVWSSYDEGQTFINPIQFVFDGEQSAYSVLSKLQDGSIGMVVETTGDEVYNAGESYGDITYFNFDIDYLEGMTHPRRLTHHDGFGNQIDRARSGTGWSGSWSAGATFTGEPEAVLKSASIIFEDFDRGRRYGRMDLVGAQSTDRSLSRAIDLGAGGQTYVSLLVSRQLDDSANGATDEELRIELLDSGSVAQASFGIDSTEAFFVDGLGARQTGPSGEFSMAESYLLVAKIVSSATGDDQLFLKSYANGTFGSGSVESDVVWTLVGETGAASSTVLDQIALVGSADAHWAVDELRIGDSWSSVAGEDTDEDGLDDAWEIKHFTNLTATDGTGDADEDSMSDAAEAQAGTDPWDAASKFTAAIQTTGGDFLLTWPSISGQYYGVGVSTNLTAGIWMPEASRIFATPPTNTLTVVPPVDQNAFYRIITE